MVQFLSELVLIDYPLSVTHLCSQVSLAIVIILRQIILNIFTVPKYKKMKNFQRCLESWRLKGPYESRALVLSELGFN